MLQQITWIKPAIEMGEIVPMYQKNFCFKKTVSRATLLITALGVYEASLNGTRISDYVLAPGWTAYHKRLQYQEYDITHLLAEQNTLQVLVGKGWYRGQIPAWPSDYQGCLRANPPALFALLQITYEDGSTEAFSTDTSWTVSESAVRFSDLYDGEIYDSTVDCSKQYPVCLFDGPTHTLIPQEGEEVREQERLSAARVFTTPKGEIVVDFGQEVTGYIETPVNASKGDIVDLSFAEVMDKEGNFYNENYRSAKAQYHYICSDGLQTYKPKLTFWGFRYVRVNSFPGGTQNISPDTFTAIVVHSQLKRIGRLSCSHPLLNRLFSNIIWGQKDNFLDIPTDCPQRDERLGWTGDAQVFVRTACYNFHVEKFFRKWLADLAAEQKEDGCVPPYVPNQTDSCVPSAAWGDAAVICPWEVYLAYGHPEILEAQYESMHKWVDYITNTTTTPGLWLGATHYADWLGLDAPAGSYKGSSRADFIASAYYAYSTALVIKAGKVLKKDVSAYEALYSNILTAFRETFPDYRTQTECALAVFFRLAPDLQATADQLAQLVKDAGVRLQTGFVGTPYLLHALSDFGHTELAYSLLLREQYPSWLYPVTKGATTIWEHWDGIMENGDFWSADMNSYNHYAYGAVADWIYGVAAGIKPLEEAPGYEKVLIAPVPDARLDWLKAELETEHGLISSYWRQEKDFCRYEITTPVEATVIIDGKTHQVAPGTHIFYR